MRVGILGAGQLGKMLAMAGNALGITCTLLDPTADACGKSAGHLLVGAFDDPALLALLAERSDVITYEFENVPADAVRLLERRSIVHPSASVLDVTQDRVREKELARRLGIGTAPFEAVDDFHDLPEALLHVGLPCILKTRRMGYDGKGQWRIDHLDRLPDPRLLHAPGGLIAEGFVSFDMECSFIGVRTEKGEMRFFPPARNVHRDGILHTSVVPAGLSPDIIAKGEAALGTIMEALRYVGVCTMECFVCGDALLLNELAPRVHNSGHWTIDGCATSQFAAHLRAITGMTLGSVATEGYWGMVNLVGNVPDPAALARVEGASVHLYGKAPRPGRKLGHVTVGASTAEKRDRRMKELCAIVEKK